jgi:hypothetical protein
MESKKAREELTRMTLLNFRRVERRRTSRAAMCINVLVHGEAEGGEKFKHWTRTVSVSAHGGVVVLETPMAAGQMFQVMNEYNGKNALAKVVSVRKVSEGQMQAAFAFVEGGEKFWSMAFPAPGARPLRRLVPRVASGS